MCAGARSHITEHSEDSLLTYSDAPFENSTGFINTLDCTEEEERAVRRKLDRVIVPLTTILYLLCFLDRYPISPHRVKHLLMVNAGSILEMPKSKAWQKS
jgi:hypothetical protein